MPTLPTRHSRCQRDVQRGFSLIEVMIGVAIALIGMVVIFQVLTVWEERKRTTSAGSDAQVAGAIALYGLARDIKAGGFGFASSPAMGCTINGYDQALSQVIAGPTAPTAFQLYPIQIIDGAGGAADEVRVLYGNSTSFTSNQAFANFTGAGPTPATSKKITGSRAGFRVGDLVVVSGNTPVNCDLVEVTALPVAPLGPGASTNDIDHASTGSSRFSNPAGTAAAYVNGTLNNLGPDPRWNIWQVRPLAGTTTAPRVLAWSDYLHAPGTWSEVAEGIIDMQAQYGYDDDANNRIDCPNTAATPVCEWTATLTAPPLNAPLTVNWIRVRAIRVALLARSQQYEKTAVYTPAGCTGTACAPAAPNWAGGAFVMRNADGTADDAPDDANDWRHYRYRVYQQVVPLRNMIWAN